MVDKLLRRFDMEDKALKELEEYGYFGVCPKCWEEDRKVTDSKLNIGRGHWGYCHKHMLRWFIGENLFSYWRHETEAIWERNWQLIGQYEDIEPLNPWDVLPGYLEKLNKVTPIVVRF